MDPAFLILAFINLLHELGQWFRRKINEGRDMGLVFTPSKASYIGQSFEIVEFGDEVEKQLFGEKIDYIC